MCLVVMHLVHGVKEVVGGNMVNFLGNTKVEMMECTEATKSWK